MRSRLLLAICVICLLAAACGDDNSDGTASDDEGAATTADDGGDDGATTTTQATSPAGDKPEVEVPSGEAPTELEVTDLVEGEGGEIVAGARVSVHYVGVLYDTGDEFDSSWDGEPLELTVGQGQVIPGWDEGLLGMREGGRRQLVIPPDMAYGDTAQGEIPANSTLVFVIDLVSVDLPVDPADEPEIDIPDEPASELQTTDITEGDGDPVALGDTIEVLLVSALQSTGEVVDSTWQTGFPIELPVGRTLPGLDDALIGMKVGGRRHAVVPPDLAYGAEGSPDGTIPPDETLVFVIDLISRTPAKFKNADPADEPEIDVPDEPATELQTTDITEGDGDTVESGDTIVVHYVGAAQSTGEVVDSSWSGGQPVELQIGVGAVIAGWDEGVVGMKEGGRRELIIPPEKAYGAEGSGSRIGPDETLVFIIDVVEIVATPPS